MRQGSPVEHFFGKHAGDYSRSRSHAGGRDLSALIRALKPKHDEVALDVATGTGFTAVALARRVGHVTGVDLTDEMLWQARTLAQRKDLPNTRFELGDALNISYPDLTFDIVTTRRATHHFSDVPRFLLEARRVLRVKGRLGIVDMSPPPGTEAFTNRIERLRDASHAEAFTPEKWRTLVTEADFHLQSLSVLDEALTFGRWLYPVEEGGPEEKAVRAAWKSAPSKVRTLLKARVESGEIQAWMKSRVVLVASKETS